MKTTLSFHTTTRRWVMRAVAVLGLSTLIADGGLRQDELECEDAVAYLQGCCPDWAGATVACSYDSGCGSVTETALSIDESQCILAESCTQIVASGICDKVKNLASPTIDTFGSGGSTSSASSVCP